jgi:hypothetical protein
VTLEPLEVLPRVSGRLPMEMEAEGLEEMIDLGKRNLHLFENVSVSN